MSNASDANALWVSVATTFTLTLPMSAGPGVPVKVRVAALKVSQLDRGLPFASVAL